MPALARVAKFSNKQGVSSGGVLVHELVEQQVKQLNNLGDNIKDFNTAHAAGIQAEDKVNNSKRGGQSSNGNTDSWGRFTGTMTNTYSKNGKTFNVTVSIVNNNVTSVVSKIQNPTKK